MYMLNFENKKVLILGFGREGKSTLNFLNRNCETATIGIADKNSIDERDLKDTPNVKIYSGDNYLDSIRNFDIIIKTPGIPNKLPEIKKAKEQGKIFTSQTQVFFERAKGTIVGVTGTKGKSTTVSLIHHILSQSGITSVLVGNIGKPCLDFLELDGPDIHFVFELSSHQLADLTRSPHIGVFLNIFSEHLDYYEDFDDYFTAKTHIARFQTKDDYFIFNSEDAKISKFAKTVISHTIPFNSKDDNIQTVARNPLKGRHNLYNINAAYKVAKILGIADENIQKAISSFTPLETRLEEIDTINGITFISDSLSTIPQSAIAGAATFSDKKIVQILGGFDRGVDYSFLTKEITKLKNVTGVVLIGQLADKIEKELRMNKYKGRITNLGFSPMKEIVAKTYSLAERDGIVLLSPGATSFDMFVDYKDRADQFKEAIFAFKNGKI